MIWTASKLSRNCAHHHTLSNLNPRPTRDAAAHKGKAFDIALVDWFHEGRIMPTSYAEVDAWLQTMVDNGWQWPDRCHVQVPWGLDKWGCYSPVEEKPEDSHIYVPINGVDDLLTAGRADACWIADDVLVVVDWKTGRTLVPRARINLQVNAAGIALAQRFKARAYQPGIYYAREGRWDMGDEVEDWRGAFGVLEEIEIAAGLDDKPHPGPHCSDCWERKNCTVAA